MIDGNLGGRRAIVMGAGCGLAVPIATSLVTHRVRAVVDVLGEDADGTGVEVSPAPQRAEEADTASRFEDTLYPPTDRLPPTAFASQTQQQEAIMKIVVDRARCTGIGICESVSPDHFEVGDDGRLILVRDIASDADRNEVEEAVRSCPAAALALVEERESAMLRPVNRA